MELSAKHLRLAARGVQLKFPDSYTADLLRSLQRLGNNQGCMLILSSRVQTQAKEKAQMEELEAAKAEAKAATDAFNDLRTRRYHMFMTAFNHISDSIDPIYKAG